MYVKQAIISLQMRAVEGEPRVWRFYVKIIDNGNAQVVEDYCMKIGNTTEQAAIARAKREAYECAARAGFECVAHILSNIEAYKLIR
ncbi:hypothetical protein FLK61_35385 [Paenalkalicoccus suaedae]|uniref:Uncharacterized protein n=1 Tax=Paenalkalicoccus suaedae TaxID=2592382 RepID=A0A859FF30_9BACI|nr:hypothetical protein [Paenalkalicoccus suaedae]QKS71953.1 hypothetical protein FLK61_35385 [Paenalkalicoccus suaedae]